MVKILKISGYLAMFVFGVFLMMDGMGHIKGVNYQSQIKDWWTQNTSPREMIKCDSESVKNTIFGIINRAAETEKYRILKFDNISQLDSDSMNLSCKGRLTASDHSTMNMLWTVAVLGNNRIFVTLSNADDM